MPLALWIVIVAVVCLIIWLFLRWLYRRNRVEVYNPRDSDRDLVKLKRYFRREVVERKVRSSFPNQDHAKILQLLDDEVPPFWGLERMQLNVLKLSNGNLDQLNHYISVARSERDFMKVIELSEYPESSRIDIDDKDNFGTEHKRLIERDFRQYINWLKQ
jgi:hypothetical protein